MPKFAPKAAVCAFRSRISISFANGRTRRVRRFGRTRRGEAGISYPAGLVTRPWLRYKLPFPMARSRSAKSPNNSTAKLDAEFAESPKLEEAIKANPKGLGYGA